MVEPALAQDEERFALTQGALLRDVRTHRHLTLQGVESMTDGEFKAASLSAYERGDRAISVLRLVRLAAIYGTPVLDLIPPTAVGPALATARYEGQAAEREPPRSVRIDVDRLAAMRGPGWDQLRHFVSGVRARRGARPARHLTLRSEDAWAAGAMLATDADGVVALLVANGVATLR